MLTWGLIVLSVVLGLVRGTVEGMVMIQPTDPMFAGIISDQGVRAHAWFGWYHLIGFLREALLVAVGIAAYRRFRPVGLSGRGAPQERRAYRVLLFLLCLVLVWETHEIAYAIARWGTVINPYPEHITLLDLASFHAESARMHLSRTVLIAMLAAVLLYMRDRRG